MALTKPTYDYGMNGDPTVSTAKPKEKQKKPKQEQEVYVDSKYEPSSERYYITVRVKGKTEGKICYDYENEYLFRTDKKLSKLSCVNCEDDKFLDVATESAVEHMGKLRGVRKTRFSMFRIFMNGKEIEE